MGLLSSSKRRSTPKRVAEETRDLRMTDLDRSGQRSIYFDKAHNKYITIGADGTTLYYGPSLTEANEAVQNVRN